MSKKRRKKKKKKGIPGNGLGPWQHHGAMGHSTRTKSKREHQIKEHKKEKRNGYERSL